MRNDTGYSPGFFQDTSFSGFLLKGGRPRAEASFRFFEIRTIDKVRQ
jgi:hypothetical protein